LKKCTEFKAIFTVMYLNYTHTWIPRNKIYPALIRT